jgi:glycosyltransferase involved in cell wall biosynthesis
VKAFAQVIKSVPNARLILIGEGTNRPTIENQITRYDLGKHIFVLGSIVEAARFLKAFDVFALVSKSESYGYVLHEAGLAGLPVIATDVGGITDIIRQGVDGLLIPPDTTLILADAITTLLKNTKSADKLGETLKLKMETRTVQKMVDQTTRLY